MFFKKLLARVVFGVIFCSSDSSCGSFGDGVAPDYRDLYLHHHHLGDHYCCGIDFIDELLLVSETEM